MLRFLPSITLVTVLLYQLTNAANTVIWKNHCDHDLYYWIVPPNAKERDTAFTRVPAHGEHVHQMMWHKDGGIAIKYRDVPFYTRAPAGIIQAEYNLDLNTNKLWYDSSIINCGKQLGHQDPSYCPFAHGGMSMHVLGNRGNDHLCIDASCQLGGQCHSQTYLKEGGYKGEPSLSCPLGVDLVFETCTNRSVEKTRVEGQVDPAPAPVPPVQSSTLAPWTSTPTAWTSQRINNTTTPSSSVFKATTSFVTVPAQPTRPARPQTYPVPQGYPKEAICFDADCKCYALLGGGSESGQAECAGSKAWSSASFSKTALHGSETEGDYKQGSEGWSVM